MKILIGGIAGFVGSTLALALRTSDSSLEISGFDNFVRPGSEINRQALKRAGFPVVHADLRISSDLDALPDAGWVLDAAALPSVLAGVDGKSSARQVIEHNLLGTVNLLEYCRSRRAGFSLLSTSRVYSIAPLAALPVSVRGGAYVLDELSPLPPGLSSAGIREEFPTTPPVSLYGSTKVASEQLALEYGATFGIPIWINRCGVLAGAGQFGQPEQGIFSYWINAYRSGAPLRYIGFDGLGHQVRDCLHPRDLVPLLLQQFRAGSHDPRPRVCNVAGGAANSLSLAGLSAWCADRFGPGKVGSDATPRRFDLPWLVLDSRRAKEHWNWEPRTGISAILEEIASHGEANPQWLELSR